MNLTVTTKRLSPTNTRGTRVVATAIIEGEVTVHRLTRAWDYSLDTHENHASVALELARMLGDGIDLREVPSRLSTGYRFVNCVAVRGLTVTADGVFAPTEVVPKRPATVFFTNH
jgi:hypothetical protein